jgi:hypothetical protein
MAMKQGQVIKVRTPSGATGKVVMAQPSEAGMRIAVEATIIADSYKPELVIPRGVFFGKRKPMDVAFAVIFVVMCVGTAIMALTTIASAPPILNLYDENGQISPAYAEAEQKAIKAGECTRSGRSLRAENATTDGGENEPPKNVWEVFEKAPQIPTILILLVVAIAVAWLLTLQKAAKQCVYATEHIKALCCFYMAYLTADGNVLLPLIFSALGVFFLVFFYYFRVQFDLASGILSQASTALRKNPQIFIISVAVYVCYLCYLMLFMGYLMNVGRYQVFKDERIEITRNCEFDIDTGDRWCPKDTHLVCTLGPATWTVNATQFFSLVFLWVTGVFQQIRLFIITGSVATWWFHSAGLVWLCQQICIH